MSHMTAGAHVSLIWTEQKTGTDYTFSGCDTKHKKLYFTLLFFLMWHWFVGKQLADKRKTLNKQKDRYCLKKCVLVFQISQ